MSIQHRIRKGNEDALRECVKSMHYSSLLLYLRKRAFGGCMGAGCIRAFIISADDASYLLSS